MSVSEGHAATRITLIWVTLLPQVWVVAKGHVDLVRGTVVTGVYTDVCVAMKIIRAKLVEIQRLR